MFFQYCAAQVEGKNLRYKHCLLAMKSSRCTEIFRMKWRTFLVNEINTVMDRSVLSNKAPKNVIDLN